MEYSQRTFGCIWLLLLFALVVKCESQKADCEKCDVTLCNLTGSGYMNGICVGPCEKPCKQCRDDMCVSCKTGYFGASCQEICKETCDDRTCDRKSGLCYSGTVAESEISFDITRTVSIWLAGTIIISVIISVILIIVIVRCTSDVKPTEVTSYKHAKRTSDFEVEEIDL